MAGLTFNGSIGRLKFEISSKALDIGVSTGFTLGTMAQCTNSNGTWIGLISGETSGGVSQWGLERTAGSGFGGAGTPPNDTLSYWKRLSGVVDGVWTGESSSATNLTNALRWFSSDGMSFIWLVKPAGGSSIPFVKVFTLSGTTWTEKALSPQNCTFQVGNCSSPGSTGYISVGQFESVDPLAGDIHLSVGGNTPLTSAAINTLMTTKTTAAVIAAMGVNDFLIDASDALTTDLIGGRSRTSNVGTSAATALTAGAWTFGTGGAVTTSDTPVSRWRRTSSGLLLRTTRRF